MVKDLIKIAKEAQAKYANFTQAQVDKIFYEAAKAANDARIPLAKMAVEETGMGIVEDKITKNHFASEMIYNKYKHCQTVGTFFEDDALGIEKIYEPVGVIGAIIPTTNPTSTAIFKTLIALKTRNAIVISAHPRAWKATTTAAQIVLDAAIKAGAPEGLVSFLPAGAPLEATNDLMKEADLILATGGGGLVKAAYSSGTPAIGVGAGNCPALIDESANIPMAVSSIIQSNTFDNGVVCATENSIVCMESVYDKFVAESIKQGVYVVDNAADIAKIEKGMFKAGKFGLLNADMVGQTPQSLAKVFGINVPAWAKVIFVVAKGSKYEDALAHEKLSTLVSLYKAADFDQAIQIQKELLLLGPGHTSSIFIDERKNADRLTKYKTEINTGRLIVNTPSSLGGVGDLYNFGLAPTLTIGCGSWGGNIFSENIGIQHLMNIKTLAKRRENMLWFRVPPKVYFKYGATGEAFKDLRADNVERAIIVTDSFIWSLYGEKFTKLLNDLDIKFTVFSDVEPNPSIATCVRGAKMMESFKPDAIIALGGGSPIDAAKIMWLYYEYPEVNFHDLALRFADIRKRIVKYPNMGTKAQLVCIPTTAGTGSEVTPFAVITDEKTHIKYPLADYALTPNMAIIDGSLMMQLPKGMTAATGLDAVTHNIEAIGSLLASEFTNPLAFQSIKLLWEYLPLAYSEGTTNQDARQYVANAAAMAGMAFANAFLGIVHSLSHKIGGHLGVVHGLANAIYLPHVIYYNSQEGVREKQGYFSQYKTPSSVSRYVEIANALGLKGSNDLEKVDSLIEGIRKLTASMNCPLSTQAFGVKDEDLAKVIDQMAEEAYDDQCTGANPRIPLITDLKRIYNNAHFDVKIPSLANPNAAEFEAYNGVKLEETKIGGKATSSSAKSSSMTVQKKSAKFSPLKKK
ncbi:MAG: bifunctional acetaldehyde-CoA/alcohol dehydrogenase [Mycoplasma sp.]